MNFFNGLTDDNKLLFIFIVPTSFSITIVSFLLAASMVINAINGSLTTCP